MADYRQRELTTKDDVPLSEIYLDGMGVVDVFNDADRPFRSLLAQDVSERTFMQQAQGDMTWEEISEGEAPRTGDVSSQQIAMSVAKYGRSLGFTQEFIEDNPSEQVTKRFNELIEGALDKENEVLQETLESGVADGSELWYDVPDHGAYSFTRSHDHTFADSEELFGDTSSYTPTAHIRESNKELRHHGKRPTTALVSSEFAAQFVDELAWDASYSIPDATTLRGTALPETTITIDGVSLLQTPYLNDAGASSYTYYVIDDSNPIYFHEARPVQMTNGEYGGPVGSPASLIGAWGSARYGTLMVDPLAAVKVTADSLA